MAFQPIDILGYIGMVIVITSFLFKNIKWVRIVNMIGAVACTIYAFLCNPPSYPTAGLNISLFIINGIMLIMLFKKEKNNKINIDKSQDDTKEKDH